MSTGVNRTRNLGGRCARITIIMARKNVKTTNLLGAVPQLVQFITNHSATLTEKGGEAG